MWRKKISAVIFTAIVCLLQPPNLRCTAAAQISPASSQAGDKVEFDVVSVRPSPDNEQLHFDPVADGYSARHAPLMWIILEAFSPEPPSFWRPNRLSNAPAWVMKEPYDIEARVDEQTAEVFKTMNDEERMRVLRPMLRRFLLKRFGLALHIEEGTGNAYALTANQKKLKLTPSSEDGKSKTPGIPVGGGGAMMPSTDADGGKELIFNHVSMTKLSEVLSGFGEFSDTPIIDRTGLTGAYDFVLKKNEASTTSASDSSEPRPATNWDIGALGLGLSKTTMKTHVLVVDHVNRPTEN